MRHSLRLRLLLGTLVIVLLIWVALSFLAWREAMHESDELFDAHLAQTASLLAAFVGDDAEEIAEHLPNHPYARKVAFQVWQDGKLTAHSATAPDHPLSGKDEGFSDVTIDGADWRIYSLRDPHVRQQVQVGEAHAARQVVAHELALHLLKPLALALPLLGLALILLIRSSLAPLSRLADSIGQRSPDRLDAISLEGAPSELHPILERLNSLLGRIAGSLEQERRFTADAAHELRTPLAAMRTHAQVAQASQDEAERQRALSNVIAATDRATHLVEQLLTLARLDSDSRVTGLGTCDLRACVIDALARIAPQALDKGVELALEEGAPLAVRGEPVLLSVLLRNLLDNAVRYSPVGSRVRVRMDDAGDAACLSIEDQGPGIPAAERAHVLDRFYRIAGSRESGSGLGLSIVARIAQLHKARLELDDSSVGRGLRVSVHFPL
ncbi:ATP-binding protein [Denitratisoma oestradiolicum]|uniref:histidine kinase n=1 Tax=Denitratisoma oestradiolicum TaxID=311182 RepID=A0A6S6XZU3_9PROT|nr:ATP-binding protein [Denitratisoma oestradiolicum]TWO80171.1 hypothetical protein CBW56_11445 [Denitratisoma oestradiolicum]CAB1369981.1 Signal transduction histidine kinase [Denitratisoma oestradiolicum]